MLAEIEAHLAGELEPMQVTYEFAHTFAWEDARRRNSYDARR
jgi:hypothetical protein